ncbi:MAG TPA: hypothetical protein VFW44_14885 [Bryobacteraceae bacterium]|nr:hypothetical protein [Bryobacteraceae bacterium]
MKSTLAVAGSGALIAAGLLIGFQNRALQNRLQGGLHIDVTTQAVRSEVRRFGINLGSWTTWGAEQLPSNVLKNPGFEGLIDRALVIVAYSAPGEFSDDTKWLARPDGFWAGATFEVLTGRTVGTKGRIRDSRAHNSDGLPVFYTEGPDIPFNHGDVVALTKIDDTQLPAGWWLADAKANKVVVSAETRPASAGVRSLALHSGGQVFSYLDRIGQRSGQLLPVDGAWRLAFWSRAPRGTAVLTAQFLRHGEAPFFTQRLEPAGAWRQYEFTFETHGSASADFLQLSFQNAGPGDVLVDDVSLARVSDHAAFRAEVVETLRKLRPGYLRDWEGQLGDTLANRIALPEGRRAYRYRPAAGEVDFGYGLPEFLELSRGVGADPWLVVPTTFSGDECAGLGQWLAANATGFGEVLLEFGNENWNGLFRPAGIPDPATHGEAADRCFERIKIAAGGLKFKTVINAHAANPEYAARMARAAPAADMVAVAPYFLFSLPAGLAPEAAKAALFVPQAGGVAPLVQRLPGGRPEVAIYEVNLHTVFGDASPEERNAVLHSSAAGAALARVMLESLRAGAIRQCAYVLAGYDARLEKRDGYVELWGLTRDLAAANHFRVTGRALVLLNQVIRGTLARSDGEGRGVAVYPFLAEKKWSAAVINESDQERQVEIQFAAGTALPAKAVLLTDEGTTEPHVGRLGSTLTIQAPPQSLIVLPAQGEGT